MAAKCLIEVDKSLHGELEIALKGVALCGEVVDVQRHDEDVTDELVLEASRHRAHAARLRVRRRHARVGVEQPLDHRVRHVHAAHDAAFGAQLCRLQAVRGQQEVHERQQAALAHLELIVSGACARCRRRRGQHVQPLANVVGIDAGVEPLLDGVCRGGGELGGQLACVGVQLLLAEAAAKQIAQRVDLVRLGGALVRHGKYDVIGGVVETTSAAVLLLVIGLVCVVVVGQIALRPLRLFDGRAHGHLERVAVDLVLDLGLHGLAPLGAAERGRERVELLRVGGLSGRLSVNGQRRLGAQVALGPHDEVGRAAHARDCLALVDNGDVERLLVLLDALVAHVLVVDAELDALGATAARTRVENGQRSNGR